MEGKDVVLALSQLVKIGPSRLARLRAYFNTWEAIWQAPFAGLLAAGLEADLAQELVAFRKAFDLETLKKKLIEAAVSFVTIDDKDYPPLLKQTYLPPPVIYYRGTLSACTRPTVAIVGTRKATTYGKQVVEQLAADLAKTGLAIVSGLALGIDALAHQAAIDNDARTIAVLGSGADMIYPRTNHNLAQRIIERGCLVSEFPLGTPPFKTNFPRRNRLIAGLSLGTIVIEAAEKSGSLITARYALLENREVMAVPGNIYVPTSLGTNNLIKLGAKPITSANDVLSALRLEHLSLTERPKIAATLTPGETEILTALGWEPMHVNELARLTILDMSAINSRLTTMELKGVVKNMGNLRYVRLL